MGLELAVCSSEPGVRLFRRWFGWLTNMMGMRNRHATRQLRTYGNYRQYIASAVRTGGPARCQIRISSMLQASTLTMLRCATNLTNKWNKCYVETDHALFQRGRAGCPFGVLHRHDHIILGSRSQASNSSTVSTRLALARAPASAGGCLVAVRRTRSAPKSVRSGNAWRSTISVEA